MEDMDVDQNDNVMQHPSADPFQFARCYQVEALEQAMKQNTIVYLDTGSGKTLVAIMLLRSYSYFLRKDHKPSPFIAVFLVPKVVLVSQQARAIKLHTDLKVGMYWGDMGVDFWDGEKWKCEIQQHEVFVMTPAILLRGLRHRFFDIRMIKLLIMDECHHAKGQDPYACIMKEFYHRELKARTRDLPRILGLTASPIKSKGGVSEDKYWEEICKLEITMNSKVYTCAAESVIAEFVPFSTPKFEFYRRKGIPCALYARVEAELTKLKQKYEKRLCMLELEPEKLESTRKRLSKIFSTLIYCLDDLGLWFALKAADAISRREVDDFFCSNLEDETIGKDFSKHALKMLSTGVPSDETIADNIKGSVDTGHITNKVSCLVETLLDYRTITDIRCIVFVERVITAVVLQSLLNKVFAKYNGWKAGYIAGCSSSSLRSQTRKQHNEIVEEFSQGKVNIIVSTSILEEGLDVQRCNLVVRFDPSLTVDSFIQSRGRARMQNSEYILMVDRGDKSTHSRLQMFLKSGDIMRKESLRHASLPCEPLPDDSYSKEIYCVESTGAIVTLSSSVSLIYYYCSHLPSDGYFKPAPRFVTCKEMGTCTLYLPKSCPLEPVFIEGDRKLLKQKVCLEACKQLHKIGALTDELLPDIVREAADAEFPGNESYHNEHPSYFPPELVHQPSDDSSIPYHCYLIKLVQNYKYDVHVDDIVLAVRGKLGDDINGSKFTLEVERGVVTVELIYLQEMNFSEEEVLICQRFQSTVLNVLLRNSAPELETSDSFDSEKTHGLDYILLPITNALEGKKRINWKCVFSVGFSDENIADHRLGLDSPRGHCAINTKNGLICSCKLDFSLVCTPHNGNIYCVNGFFEDMNANSPLPKRDGTVTTYADYFAERHGIKLCFKQALLLRGRHIFHVQNCLHHHRHQKEKALSISADLSQATVELPPELCSVILAPVSISALYSFSFVPSIMHRIEALLVAANLKRMHSDHCMQNVVIPATKLLEAITTKRCHEEFHLESLETLGDSFLKYAACQQLFKTYQNHHEGMLSLKKDRMVSNAALCHLGCDKKLPGFIRNEPFDPKKWIVPSRNLSLCEESFPGARKMYIYGKKNLRSKTVADAVEALLGAYVSTGGENAGLLFMDWLGLKIDFVFTPYKVNLARNPEKLLNINHIESLLNYSFHNPSILVEALTHGSYMVPEIPSCYQRLEFLGDSVLDYLITVHLYKKHPGLSPGVLTDLRSASVNNDCYALSAVKAGLHKHILHASYALHKQITEAVIKVQDSPVESTFGWDSEIAFPKVLGDIVESLAGAILVDSGYDKEKVFNSIRPLLEPLVTPETIRHHPVKELTELCRREQYVLKPPALSRNGGGASIKVVVEAGGGKRYEHTATSSDKKTAKKIAAREMLRILKERIPNLD